MMADKNIWRIKAKRGSLAVKEQRGVVLIMALLIVALVTTIVVSVTWRFNLGMARNENRWHGAQARAYLEAAEMLTTLGLEGDFVLDPETDVDLKMDHLGEQWAVPGMPFPTDEGWVRGDVEDAQSRINLNLLVANPKYDETKDPPLDKFSESQKRFIRLLQLIELDSGDLIDETFAIALVHSIQDWIDGDNEPAGYDSAESNYYEGLDPPYPIANREMATVSELSMVKGMTPELYTKLLPYVTVLPGVKTDRQMYVQNPLPLPAYMNINTMKPLLLRTLNRKDKLIPLDEEEWLVLMRARGDSIPGEEQQGIEVLPPQGFKELKLFFELDEVKNIVGSIKDKEFDPADLGINSRYFYLNTETLVGEQIRRGKALLFRDPKQNGKTRVIRRTSANY